MPISKDQLKKLQLLRDALVKERDLQNRDNWDIITRLVLTELSTDRSAQRKLRTSKAQQYTSLATNALQGWAFGRSISWMHIVREDASVRGREDDKSITEWFQECERLMLEDLSRSSFYDEAQSVTDIVLNMSTSIMLQDWDVATETMIYETVAPTRCAIQQDVHHRVDTLFYDFYLTKDQAEQAFGDRCPKKISDSKDYGTRWKFVKAYLPADRYDLDVDGDEPYVEIIWSSDEPDRTVSERSLWWKPFICWRFQRSKTGSPWGVGSPGERCIPEIVYLNAMEKSKLKGVQLRNDPPVDVTEGLEIEIAPAAINYISANKSWAWRGMPGSSEEISIEIQRKEQTLKEAYYVDFFLILQQSLEKKKTATEASLLADEKSQIMSSFTSRLNNEFLEPVLETLFQIEAHYGRLPEPPVSIQGQNIKIDYVSPLAIAQKKAHIYAPARQFVAETLAFNDLDPSVRYIFKVPEYAETMSRELMIDQRFVRSAEEVQELVEQDRQRAQQQMAQEQENARTQAAANAYRALSVAPEKGSPAAQQQMAQ